MEQIALVQQIALFHIGKTKDDKANSRQGGRCWQFLVPLNDTIPLFSSSWDGQSFPLFPI
jgi:aminopeptidase C